MFVKHKRRIIGYLSELSKCFLSGLKCTADQYETWQNCMNGYSKRPVQRRQTLKPHRIRRDSLKQYKISSGTPWRHQNVIININNYTIKLSWSYFLWVFKLTKVVDSPRYLALFWGSKRAEPIQKTGWNHGRLLQIGQIDSSLAGQPESSRHLHEDFLNSCFI